ncbi:MAG: general secretion pathway protein GspK [Bdellovibrionaceae bacterium]|nr:general secretion pathway protein GspK [Pseudobdellovibrionaceae bacterium]
MLAIVTMGLLTYLAMEVMYDSTVEYTVNSQGLNRLKAYYAAKSGLEIGLLRVKVYQQVMKKMNPTQLGAMGDYVDEIWKFPFTWPLMLPDNLNAVEKEQAKDTVKDTFMDASYALSITDEGSKLDLNDLVSKSKTLQDTASRRLLEIFERKQRDDEEWRRKYGGTRFEDLVNAIADWMSDKNSGRGGNDKRSGYNDLNRESPNSYPPNRGFRTVQELRLVSGMNDDFFDLLAPQVTIYGMRGVNPNVASKDVLMSLDRGITSEVADELIQRRSDPKLGGPYKSPDDFWSYANQKGARLEAADSERPPITTDPLTTFRIKSTGEYGGATREIEVIVADFDRISTNIKQFIDKDNPKETPPGGGTPPPGGGGGGLGTTTTTTTNSTIPSKGPPRIVYWTER